MIITYFGKQYFKIQHGDLVIAINPINKDSKTDIKIARFGSQIALSTTNHNDYNGFENASHGETKPFHISGPGDYEIQGTFIKGVMSEVILAGQKYMNTIYSFSIDGISICFLGAINTAKIETESREKIEPPDIVFVPIGNNDMLSPTEAYKLAVSFDAGIIIPMDYGLSEKNFDGKNLKTFLKEGGQENTKEIDKLTLKSKDLIGKESEIVVLSI